jgi:transcriptional regulator with XRE-family HTH domain
MSLKQWERKVLKAPGAAARVAEIESELRVAAGLTALREKAGLSQRQLAKRIGVSQPRVAAIERSRNVTLDVLEQYVHALGGKLEVTVARGAEKLSLMGSGSNATRPARVAKAKPARTGRKAGSKTSGSKRRARPPLAR